VAPDLALNTAVSFVTNTNWQNYLGETTMSNLTQMLGLTVQNFLSAAFGLVIAIALVRGLVRRGSPTIGNFWADLVRGTVYLLLPVATVLTLVFIWQGMPQTLNGPVDAATLQGVHQTIAIGPIADQEAIKQLGNNGGGFLNANAAHPFENPTPLSNWLSMFAEIAIPFSLTYTFGRMAGDQRQGWVIFGVMMTVLVVGGLVAMQIESGGNPLFPAGIDQALGNMTGKETRLGAAAGGLYSAVTTGTSTGAVNAMHDSFLPMAGFVPMFLIQLGEITPGGIGAGLYGILVFAILSVFIAGLMVGRTPEYLGKKVEGFEMKMAMLVVLFLATGILVPTAIATVTDAGLKGPLNPGPHGFSEILYAFTSSTGNNGSAFAGLTGNTVFYNVFGSISMLVGRFGMVFPILAIAGSMAAKRRVAPSLGTMPTNGPLFGVLLVGVIIIVGALTFFPALALGPIVEQLLLNAGKAF
jgi:K+-transporting ATPase ATPase A chain